MSRNHFILFIFLAATISCRQKYEIAYQQNQTSFLVVEGAINTDGVTRINLSRTTMLSQKGIAYENGADVSIQGEDNSLYQLNDLDSGRYVSDTLLLNENVRYRMNIKTIDNRQYISAFVQPIKTPRIDSITWTRYGGGIEIFVNSHDNINNTQYYRFDYEETWEFKSKFGSYIYAIFTKTPPGIGDIIYGVYDPINNTYNDSIYTCWQSRISKKILIGSTAKLAENRLYTSLLTYPRGAEELSFLYSINVNQQGISKEGYEFLEKVKKNTESLGSIFDALPSEIPGNFTCITDTLEKVIGFIDASRIRSRRKFISNAELENWNIGFGCTEEFIKFDAAAEFDRIIVQERMPTRYGFEGQRIAGIATAPKECVDCTLRGAHIRPDFWPY
jgi:hypothetical protein